MRGASSTEATWKKPGSRVPFLLQSAVLVPVFLLAVLGCWLLFKDRKLANQEAAATAADLTDRMGESVGAGLARFIETGTISLRWRITPTNELSSFTELSQRTAEAGIYAWLALSNGVVSFPPSIGELPVEGGLIGEASIWLEQARAAEFQQRDFAKAFENYEKAFHNSTNTDARVLAAHGAGQALLSKQDSVGAQSWFQRAFDMGKDRSEHIAQLAGFKLVMVSNRVESDLSLRSKEVLPRLLSRLLAHPTKISSEILERLDPALAEQAQLKEQIKAAKLAWDSLELTRTYATFSQARQPPSNSEKVQSIEIEERAFVLISWPSEKLGEMVHLLIDESKLRNEMETLLANRPSGRDARHFSFKCRFGDLEFQTNRVMKGLASSVVKVRPAGTAETPGFSVVVSAGLSDPDAYFSSQRQRTQWFVIMIVLATAIAVTGLLLIRQAMDRAFRFNELKSNFVSSVSHELRAPLASVRLLAESLERGKVEDAKARQEYYHLIVQECRRLGGLVENLLNFSRRDRGKEIELETQSVDLEAVVLEAVTILRPHAQEKGVALELRTNVRSLDFSQGTCILTLRPEQRGRAVHESGSMVRADARALLQVILNILDNALKYSPPGAAIQIELQNNIVSISDAGPGIPFEEHQKIFEMFYRIGSELTRETAGVGIGLGLVKQILEAHGAGLYLESAPGKGSRFLIVLEAAAAVVVSK